MAKQTHLTVENRIVIQTGITSAASFECMGEMTGKDPTTIAKEIRLHRYISHESNIPGQCKNYAKCKKAHMCSKPKECPNYEPFKCKRRDKSPGACNGCNNFQYCRFIKYKYDAYKAQKEYDSLKVSSREGANLSEDEAKYIANTVKQQLLNGQSPYVILINHPELNITEKTFYTYIEDGVLKKYGIDAFCLRRQLRRKIPKKKACEYKKRADWSFLVNRKYSDYLIYISENPNINVVEMDTVYNDVSNGPFMQTFKFLNSGLLIAIYHDVKDAKSMVEGVDILEEALGTDIFRKYFQVLLTDRGMEFSDVEGLEKNNRTKVFYCDPMASCQKGSLENNHEELRYHFPKEKELREIGLISQKELNLSLSHINSIKKEKLNGKSPIELTEFLFPDLMGKLNEFGIRLISPDEIILNPSLFKK